MSYEAYEVPPFPGSYLHMGGSSKKGLALHSLGRSRLGGCAPWRLETAGCREPSKQRVCEDDSSHDQVV